MSNHQHGHGCGCNHGSAGLQGEELGLQYSLYQKIDLENVTCLNEAVEHSGKLVFKPWEDRKDLAKVNVHPVKNCIFRLLLFQFVISDADEELLFNIPFTGNVKLKGLIIMGGEDGHHPSSVKL